MQKSSLDSEWGIQTCGNKGPEQRSFKRENQEWGLKKGIKKGDKSNSWEQEVLCELMTCVKPVYKEV